MSSESVAALQYESQLFVLPIPFKAHRISGFEPEFFEKYYEDGYGRDLQSLSATNAQIAVAKDDNSSNLGNLIAKQSELINLVYLEELFLSSLGEDGGDELADDTLKAAISRDFGSVLAWSEEFVHLACAKTDAPEWAVLTYCERFNRLINVSYGKQSVPMCGLVPILAVDLREHVYSTSFGDDRSQYVNKLVASINWSHVAARLKSVNRKVPLGENQDEGANQISIQELLEITQHSKTSPLVLDVRHEDDRERYGVKISDTEWRDSFSVDTWSHNIPKDKPVVVYCMYGFWVSQKVAEELRAEGIDARSLVGGISAWRAMGLPCS